MRVPVCGLKLFKGYSINYDARALAIMYFKVINYVLA